MARIIVRVGTLALTLTLLLVGCRGASEAPQNGVWKVQVLAPSEEVTVALVEITQKGETASARLLSAGLQGLQGGKAEVQIEGNRVRLTLSSDDRALGFVGYLPEGETRPQTLRGYAEKLGERHFCRWERSEPHKLNPNSAVLPVTAYDSLKHILSKSKATERETALRAFVEEHVASPISYTASLELLGVLTFRGAPEEELSKEAERNLSMATPYGPEMRQRALLLNARILLGSGKPNALALEYARQAESQLSKDATIAEQVPVIQALHAALRRLGKTEEAGPVAERLAKLEAELDKEFAADAVPFPTPPLPRSSSGRVVLVELLTSAHCGPCVAAVVAYNGLMRSRQGGDVVLVQYHLLNVGPDALSNPDSRLRGDYYNPPGTPHFLVNGHDGPPIGGPKELGREGYGDLVRAAEEARKTPPEAKLTLTVTRQGEVIRARTDVADLKRLGAQVRLRLLLVQGIANYTGRNGQRVYHNVVRAQVGEPTGQPLLQPSGTQEAQVDLNAVRKGLAKFLDGLRIPEESRPLQLEGLKVIAFVQDDATKEILQTTEAVVPE